MHFDLNKTFEILEKTPIILQDMLSGLSEDWVMNYEGLETWSPYDVVGHLIHGEHTDWMGRLEKILYAEDNKFIPFNRLAQFEESRGKTLPQLLEEFATLRKNNLQKLKQ